jgi:hypothetical protein
MKKLIPLLICFYCLQLLLVSCSEKSDPSYDEENFTAIFDNNQFTAASYPIDFKQTADGGYLILGGRRISNDSDFAGIYLIKADKTGKFVSIADSLSSGSQYMHPIGELMAIADKYYFFCMDEFTRAYLVETDADLQEVKVLPLMIDDQLAGITYPAAAAYDGQDLLLLSYNHAERQMMVSRHSPAGNVIGSTRSFDIGVGDEVEEPIINHFIRTGKKFPFQVGRIKGGSYFFNGFENYTFSLIFTGQNNEGPDEVVNGQQDDGGLSAIYPLGGTKFAVSRFNFGDNYFLPNINLPAEASGIDEIGYMLPELVNNAPVKIIGVETDTKSVLIFASNTKSKQIGLFFYDEATGEFISSRYLGFSNPFEVASILQTEDGGLAVCGTAYLAGRFSRMCLIKISKAELLSQVN